MTGEDYITRNFTVLLVTKYYSDNQIEKNERGWACGTYGAEWRCIQSFSDET
jgi:hypothetical protein